MTIIWLIVFLVFAASGDTPSVHMWNGWAITLAICLTLDVLSALND